MSLTVYPCHAAADEPIARELAKFLEAAVDVTIFLEESGMRAGETLLRKVRDGLIAEVVLVLLSPDSSPAQWVLEEWKPVFMEDTKAAGVSLASVLVRECPFPGLLRRQNFFDLTGDHRAGFRALKRWLLELRGPMRQPRFVPAKPPADLRRESALGELEVALCDTPGSITLGGALSDTWLALEFARKYGTDFEDVFWLAGEGRSLAALAGDLGAQLSLKLDGDPERNIHSLRERLARRRYLLVMDAVGEPEAVALSPGGRASVLRVAPDGPPVALETLAADERRLLEAMAVCSTGGFALDLAAAVAGMDPAVAAETARQLLERGMVAALDRDGERCYLPQPVRRGLAPREDFALRHAAAPNLDLAELQQAFDWSLAHADLPECWAAASSAARRLVSLARGTERFAEGYACLERLYRAAEPRAERRLLEECAWEMVWILEHWERYAEARALDRLRRSEYADQMSLQFD